MRILKDIIGLIVSAAITGALFLGAPIIGVIISLLPTDLVETLTTSDRPAVYFDGAYELSPVEIDGDLNGTELTPSPDEPDAAEPEDPDEQEGVADAAEKTDPKSKVENTGAEVVANPAGKAPGTTSGTRRGNGRTSGVDGVKHPKGATKKQSRRKCPKSFEGISKGADGTYQVSRKLVNYHTSSVKRFNELGWSKSNDTGDKKGWYVNGFGCRDALWHGGVRRGDIVLTVNGKKTNNMMQILMLYQKVKTRKNFEVVVRRKGKKITLKYRIVKG